MEDGDFAQLVTASAVVVPVVCVGECPYRAADR